MNAMKTSWKQAVLAVAASLLLAGCGGSAEKEMEAQKASQAAGPMNQEGAAEKDVEARKLVLATAVARFADDCQTLPDSLGELLDSGKAGWKGPYLEDRDMLLDPWGREFIYVKNDHPFDGVPCVIVSAGPKGTVLAAEAQARAQLRGTQDRAKAERAKSDIRAMKKAVLAGVMDDVLCGGKGEPPDSLRQLIDEGVMAVSPDFLVDPWGHEYIYSKEGKDGELCEIYSAGPDGVAGTGDDVHAKND